MSMLADDSKRKPRAAKQTAYSKLFDEADQNRIRADLSVFFGPNADTFLETYEKMRSETGTRRNMPKTWSWPVFLGSFVWFFYRKMYAYGAIIILLPIILGYLFASASGGGSMVVVFAFNANGSVGASAATVLSIFPIAFGIDSIRTGLARRKLRLARAAEAT